jgi:CheY-like chemotaxis protein
VRPTESIAVTCRILHVSDNDADHQALVKALKSDRSFSVERARSGVEALQQLRHKLRLPNLVIATWSYARMTCAEFVDQMKSDRRLALIPIIITSSDMSPQKVNQAYDAGAACVLRTGSDPESLTRGLEALKQFWRLVMLPFCDSPARAKPARRQERLTSQQRSAIGKKAVNARWARAKGQ